MRFKSFFHFTVCLLNMEWKGWQFHKMQLKSNFSDCNPRNLGILRKVANSPHSTPPSPYWLRACHLSTIFLYWFYAKPKLFFKKFHSKLSRNFSQLVIRPNDSESHFSTHQSQKSDPKFKSKPGSSSQNSRLLGRSEILSTARVAHFPYAWQTLSMSRTHSRKTMHIPVARFNELENLFRNRRRLSGISWQHILSGVKRRS